MRLVDMRIKQIDGQRWYMAEDAAQLFGLKSVSVVSKALDLYPNHKQIILINPKDWRFKKSYMYISEYGLLLLARRYGTAPLREFKEQVRLLA